MTARFWRLTTLVLGLVLIASVVVWWCALGWHPSVEHAREVGRYGYVIGALTVLVSVAYDRYSAAARRGPDA